MRARPGRIVIDYCDCAQGGGTIGLLRPCSQSRCLRLNTTTIVATKGGSAGVGVSAVVRRGLAVSEKGYGVKIRAE